MCNRQSRPIILGRDFTIPNAITIRWTRRGTKKLCMDDELVMECEENSSDKALALLRFICIPPRCVAVVKIECAVNMKGTFQVQPSLVFLRDNPIVYCKPFIYDMTPPTKQDQWDSLPALPTNQLNTDTYETEFEPMNTTASPKHMKKNKDAQTHHTSIPLFITNLSSTSRVVLPKEYAVAFVTPKVFKTNYIEISEVQLVERQCKNWVTPKKLLPKVPTSDFPVSPGSINESRKCDLPDVTFQMKTAKVLPNFWRNTQLFSLLIVSPVGGKAV